MMEFEDWFKEHGMPLSAGAGYSLEDVSRRAWNAAVAAECARCVRICEEHAADKNPPFKDYEDNYLNGWLDAANECGWAIQGPNTELTGRCPTEVTMTEETTPAVLRLSDGLGAWQPIATAPANTWILTWGDWQDPPVGVSRYEDLTRVVERVEHESTNAKGRRRIVQEEEVKEREWQGHHWGPTHWMPLPAGPAESA